MKKLIANIYIFLKKSKIRQWFYFHSHDWTYQKRVNLGVCIAAEYICSKCDRKAYYKYDNYNIDIDAE